MPTRSNNTMAEGLQALLTDLSTLKVTPDADLEFLIGLETLILGKLREPVDNAAQQVPGLNPMAAGGGGGAPMGGPMPPAGGVPPMQMGAGELEGMLPAAQPQAGAGVGGLRSTPAMPNPDELRRVVGQ